MLKCTHERAWLILSKRVFKPKTNADVLDVEEADEILDKEEKKVLQKEQDRQRSEAADTKGFKLEHEKKLEVLKKVRSDAALAAMAGDGKGKGRGRGRGRGPVEPIAPVFSPHIRTLIPPEHTVRAEIKG